MKVLAVTNPISGDKDKSAFNTHMENSFAKYGIEYAIFKTSGDSSKDDKNLDKQIDKFQPDRLLSIGGDGTILFTARHLINKKIPFGIIPFGSANGMSVELSIPQDPKLAFDDFLKSHYIADLDLIRVNGKHYCLHIGDVGLNAKIVEGFSKDQNRGFFTYVRHFFSEIQAAELIDYEINADGKIHHHTGYILAIANARKYGTGAVLNKKGNPFDGKFELVIGLRKDIESILYLGLTRFTEEIDMQDIVEVIQCKKAHIKLKEPHLLQLDGEVIGETNEISAEIVAGAVPVVMQKNNLFLK